MGGRRKIWAGGARFGDEAGDSGTRREIWAPGARFGRENEIWAQDVRFKQEAHGARLGQKALFLSESARFWREA